MAMGRELAWRVFAQEFNRSDMTHTEGGERAPTYLVTPLGAKVNRVFVVGVLTGVERLGQQGDVLRARVTDPTGTWNLYAGQYQPEALKALSEASPPAVVAVVGKSRLYTPEAGVALASVRPETVRVVSKEERDAWILETVTLTRQRIEAIEAALGMETPAPEKLVDLGFPGHLAEGVVLSLPHYGKPELAVWKEMLLDGLQVMLGKTPRPLPASPDAAQPGAQAAVEEVVVSSPPASPERERAQDLVAELIAKLDAGKGAPWEEIVSEAARSAVGEEGVEEAINALLDKGVVYEPVLGRLKKT